MFSSPINDIYSYEALRTLGLDLIGLFIPIYILSQGLGFEYALGFLMIDQLISILLSIPLSRVISKIGFKHSLVLSYLFLIPGLLLLQLSKLSLGVIMLSGVAYSIGKILHGLSINSEFAVDSHSDSRDSESSKMLGIPNISRIIGPIAGGYILTYFGFSILVSISTTLFLLSAAVLLKSSEHRDPLEYDMKSLIKKNFTTTIPVFFARGILNVTGVTVFALFTFLFIGNEIDTGFVAAADNVGLMLMALISGKLSQKIDRKKIIALGLTGATALHLLRPFASTPLEALAISGLGGIAFMTYEVPLFSKFADKAEDEDILEFYTLKRIVFKAGQLSIILAITLTGLFFDLKTGFQVAFLIAGLTSASAIFWTRKDW